MILYSKSGDFLGIGKDELSFLGYEDLDEFKSVHSDLADLFINKPGYIFKFKNFSWIDYALHSGAPKKSVIIKLKTGNEVEVAIKIKELFLYNPKENEELYYSIEFANTLSQNNSMQSDSSFIQATPQKTTEVNTDEISPTEEIIQEEETPSNKTISLEEDFVEEENKDLEIDFNEEKIEEATPKLKIDTSVFEKEEDKEPTVNINDTFTEDYESEEIPKLKIDIPSEENIFEPVIDISSDYEEREEEVVDFNPPVNMAIEEEKEEDIDFDLVNCVEELGLDISLVGELITDYMSKIESNIPSIKTAIENEDGTLLKNSICELKGISDNLQMTQLSTRLGCILEANDKEDKIKELGKFEKIVTKFRGELIWTQKSIIKTER